MFNWLFARRAGGVFVLRIEDTDAVRNRPEHVVGIERALRWLGLDWDEGPYFQSQRGQLYASAIDSLLAAGSAYACDCTPEQVAARARARGGPPGYDGYCRDRGLEAVPGRAVRFRSPDSGQVSFDDLIRGEVTVEAGNIEDFAIRKSSGDPLFILANVVDDADMAISHVIRGEDHVSNTSKYLLVWEALGFGERPVFAHLPLLLNASRKKLSKRRDKVAMEDYRDQGYLPEAMRNYLGLLGWSPGGDREILGLDEMVSEFRLEDVKSAGAIFDERKLASINAEYMRALPLNSFVERSMEWLADRWSPVAPLVQSRARTFAEVFSMSDFLFLPSPVVDAEEWERAVRKQAGFAMVLAAAYELYADPELEWRAEDIKAATVEAGARSGVTQLSKAQAPVRLAVTGRSVGPPLFESLELLGRDRTLERIASAQGRIGAAQR